MWAEDDHIKSLDISHAENTILPCMQEPDSSTDLQTYKWTKVKRSMIFCCPAWDKNDKNVT